MDAGAIGLSSGLVYAPGLHAPPEELAALVSATARRGGLYATHMRNESAGLFDALRETVATGRAVLDDGAMDVRIQVSHLKCGARPVWGRADEALDMLASARAEGLDLAADQYPYAAASTTLATILPPAFLALGVEACVAALSDVDVRGRVRAEIARGISGWENVAADPGWDAIRVAYAASHPDWAGRTFGALAADLGADPADLAFDALVDYRLDVWIVIDCMDEPDVERIMREPWVAVCTDAEGRRPDHPLGTTARILGTYVRERGVLPLETAIAKLTSVPAERLGLRDRGVIREGAIADLAVIDPATVRDEASYDEPSRFPTGIPHVIVGGRPAVLDGQLTGTRAGRLIRGAA
jgi:N-acyl-D-aspartate/D-glutamate deacylase